MEVRRIKAYLDTNVLLDVLGADRPAAEASRIIFQAMRSGYLEGVLSTQSIVDAHYILSRTGDFSFQTFSQAILAMTHFVNIHGLNVMDLEQALMHPGGDFEDDIQFARADAENCDVLVTSDRHFLRREAPAGTIILTPEALVERMRQSRR